MDMATVFFWVLAIAVQFVILISRQASMRVTPGDALSKLAHQVHTAKQTDWYNRELYRTEQRLRD
jgi:hypothetical protein